MDVGGWRRDATRTAGGLRSGAVFCEMLGKPGAGLPHNETLLQRIDRILPFDVIPRVIAAAEWARLEEGLVQRLTATNLFLQDVYHDQKILNDGGVPKELVLGNANYRPEMQGVDLRHGTYVHVCGVDIIRDQEGQFRILEDNGRTPSGVS